MRIQHIYLLLFTLLSSPLLAGKHGNPRTQKPRQITDEACKLDHTGFTQVSKQDAIELENQAVPSNVPQALERSAQVKASELQAEMEKWFWKGRRDLLQKLQKEYDPARHIFGSPDSEETKSFIQETLKSMQYHGQCDDIAKTLNFIDEHKLIDLDRSLRQSLRKTVKTALSSAQNTRKKALTDVITSQSKAVDDQIKKLSATILAADEALAKQNAQDSSVIQALRSGLHATATLHKPGEVESDDEGEPSEQYATPAALRRHLGIETTTLLSDDNRTSLQRVLALQLFSAQQASESQ